MDEEIIKSIFSHYRLSPATNVKKIDVGFTNDVYDVDDSYILKVCKGAKCEPFFRHEALLYRHFWSTLPVPKVVAFDDTREFHDRYFLIYRKIHGDNLYNVWHTFSEKQRKDIIHQLCGFLRMITETDLSTLPEGVLLEDVPDWKAHVLQRLSHSLNAAQTAGTISRDETERVKRFVAQHGSCLDEQKIGLTYWDAHFDNIIVRDAQIVGLLDFERTGLASIDYMLDIVRRMIEFPKKYMSEYAEQFARSEDYQHLMEWYKEFYPELFDFTDIDRRLDLYSIEHDLRDLKEWPNVASLKENILKIAS